MHWGLAMTRMEAALDHQHRGHTCKGGVIEQVCAAGLGEQQVGGAQQRQRQAAAGGVPAPHAQQRARRLRRRDRFPYFGSGHMSPLATVSQC